MKLLKFRTSLKESILNNQKKVSWRLFDDKKLKEGEKIELAEWETGKKFGEAKITDVEEKQFHQLSKKDKKEHEAYSSDDAMYKTYSDYYGRKIVPTTKLKIIKFELIKSS